MRKLFAVAAAFMSVWCTSGSAQWVDKGVNPQSVGKIYVYLTDEAKDACWTNLREVREYAEEKLRISGYSVAVEENAFGYRLLVEVIAHRPNAQCVGVVNATLQRSNMMEGIFGFHVSGKHMVVTNQNGNLNAEVISVVQELINVM